MGMDVVVTFCLGGYESCSSFVGVYTLKHIMTLFSITTTTTTTTTTTMTRAETEKIREQKRQRLVVKYKEQQAAKARQDARQVAQRELFR